MTKNKKKFKVYVHNNEYIRVKQGVSWVGFFFTFFWLYYKKAYKRCVKIFLTMMIGFPFFMSVGNLIAKYTELNVKLNPDEVNQFSRFCGNFFCFLVAATLHYKGNKWLERDLLKEGFVEVEDVENVPKNLLFDKKRFYVVTIIYIMYQISWGLFFVFLPIISK